MISSNSIAPSIEGYGNWFGKASAACNFNEKDDRSGNRKSGLTQVAYKEGDDDDDDDDDGGYDYAPAA